MKKLILFISGILIFTSCITNPEDDSQYQYMHYQRHGGGDIGFCAYPTNSESTIMINVEYYDYKDTTKVFYINSTPTSSPIFEEFYETINKLVDIDGSYVAPTNPTGTWVDIFFSLKSIEQPVTNTELRDVMIEMEGIVRNKMEQ